jgi:hypothetical protein
VILTASGDINSKRRSYFPIQAHRPPPTTLAKTRERYITAVEELGIDKSDQTALLHHKLKGAANVFFFREYRK